MCTMTIQIRYFPLAHCIPGGGEGKARTAGMALWMGDENQGESMKQLLHKLGGTNHKVIYWFVIATAMHNVHSPGRQASKLVG